MKRTEFIRKWLGNPEKSYTEQFRDEMLDDLDAVIDSSVKNCNLPVVNTSASPYQLCPKCNGQGFVSKPPYVAGDIYEWSSSQTSFVCDVCNGAKIIPQHLC